MSKARLKIIAVIMLVTLVSMGISLGIKNKPKKFNIILIVVDGLRADHLGCYGYNRNTSPNIDKFAKEGMLFTKAYAQGAGTRISIASMFTSLYPGVHKVLKLGASLSDENITLPEIIRKNGYVTAAFVGPQLAGISNLNQRFHAYDVSPNERKDLLITPQINKKASNWLRQHYSQPFFLYLHYLDVHAPYLRPAPYNKLFWQGDISEEMKNFLKHFFVSEYFDPLKEGLVPKGEMLDFVISQYDGKIKYIDDHIKALLEEVERLGLSKNTLVILTSDHGEEFKDHGNFFHENSVYDELIHIPLILRLPEVIPKNIIIPDLVRHIDIMPTLLDMLNIHSNNIMQGVSLLPLMGGKGDLKLDVFSEAHYGGRHLKGVRTDKWEFIETCDLRTNTYSYELYDLDSDPKELNNLVEMNIKEVELLKAKLRDYNLSCEKIRKSMLGEGFIDKPVILDEEAKERLKSLGYIQ